MLEDIAGQFKIFVGLIGAALAAFVGVLARNVYHEKGFSLIRTMIDTPFAILVAIIAGGVGQWLSLPEIVIYGIAGSAGYLGPKWLAGWLRKKAPDEPLDESAE